MNIRRKLPIGIQTLAKLREGNHYYVDKTAYALQLIEQGSCYFLSRPRRFGKSLFLDTLKELFEGNRPLFTGLYAEGHWDWSRRYPVIRISFGGAVISTTTLLGTSQNLIFAARCPAKLLIYLVVRCAGVRFFGVLRSSLLGTSQIPAQRQVHCRSS